MSFDITTKQYQLCFDNIVSLRDYFTEEPEREIAFNRREFLAYVKTEHVRVTKKLVKHHAAHYDGTDRSEAIKNDTQYLKCIDVCWNLFRVPSMRKDALKICNDIILCITELKAADDKNRINCDKALYRIETLLCELKDRVPSAICEKNIALLQFKHYGSMKGSKLIICIAVLMYEYTEVPIYRRYDIDEKLVENIRNMQRRSDNDVMCIHNLADRVYEALLKSKFIETLRDEDEAFSYARTVQKQENDRRPIYEIVLEARSDKLALRKF